MLLMIFHDCKVEVVSNSFSVILVLNASSGISGKTHLVQHFLCSKQKEEPQVWFFFHGCSKRETESKLLLDVESIFLEFLGRPS